MTLKKGNLNAPQKRATYMSLKQGILDVFKKAHFFSMNNLNVLYHAAIYLSLTYHAQYI